MIVEVLTNQNVIFYILAYFVGGIPFGLLLCKVFFKIDIRKSGSCSIGATNVYRVLKQNDEKSAKLFSILTMLLDAFKGLILILIAKFFGVGYETQWAIALLCVIGHCYSPYLNFTGGKGVATAIGSIILLVPLEGVIGLCVWLIAGKVFKISSISSLLGVIFAVASSFLIHPNMPHIDSHVPLVLMGVIIFYNHIPNIFRLFKGKEEQIL